MSLFPLSLLSYTILWLSEIQSLSLDNLHSLYITPYSSNTKRLHINEVSVDYETASSILLVSPGAGSLPNVALKSTAPFLYDGATPTPLHFTSFPQHSSFHSLPSFNISSHFNLFPLTFLFLYISLFVLQYFSSFPLHFLFLCYTSPAALPFLLFLLLLHVSSPFPSTGQQKCGGRPAGSNPYRPDPLITSLVSWFWVGLFLLNLLLLLLFLFLLNLLLFLLLFLFLHIFDFLFFFLVFLLFLLHLWFLNRISPLHVPSLLSSLTFPPVSLTPPPLPSHLLSPLFLPFTLL